MKNSTSLKRSFCIVLVILLIQSYFPQLALSSPGSSTAAAGICDEGTLGAHHGKAALFANLKSEILSSVEKDEAVRKVRIEANVISENNAKGKPRSISFDTEDTVVTGTSNLGFPSLPVFFEVFIKKSLSVQNLAVNRRTFFRASAVGFMTSLIASCKKDDPIEPDPDPTTDAIPAYNGTIPAEDIMDEWGVDPERIVEEKYFHVEANKPAEGGLLVENYYRLNNQMAFLVYAHEDATADILEYVGGDLVPITIVGGQWNVVQIDLALLNHGESGVDVVLVDGLYIQNATRDLYFHAVWPTSSVEPIADERSEMNIMQEWMVDHYNDDWVVLDPNDDYICSLPGKGFQNVRIGDVDGTPMVATFDAVTARVHAFRYANLDVVLQFRHVRTNEVVAVTTSVEVGHGWNTVGLPIGFNEWRIDSASFINTNEETPLIVSDFGFFSETVPDAPTDIASSNSFGANVKNVYEQERISIDGYVVKHSEDLIGIHKPRYQFSRTELPPDFQSYKEMLFCLELTDPVTMQDMLSLRLNSVGTEGLMTFVLTNTYTAPDAELLIDPAQDFFLYDEVSGGVKYFSIDATDEWQQAVTEGSNLLSHGPFQYMWVHIELAAHVSETWDGETGEGITEVPAWDAYFADMWTSAQGKAGIAPSLDAVVERSTTTHDGRYEVRSFKDVSFAIDEKSFSVFKLSLLGAAAVAQEDALTSA